MSTNIVPNSFFRFPSLFSRFPSVWDDEELLSFNTASNGLTVSEDDKSFYVEAAVPGIDPKNVDVTFENGVLTVKGEAKTEEQDEKRRYYQKSSRSFSYRVAIPGDVDSGKEPEATCKNGVMKITFAKSAKAQPKKISVKSD